MHKPWSKVTTLQERNHPHHGKTSTPYAHRLSHFPSLSNTLQSLGCVYSLKSLAACRYSGSPCSIAISCWRARASQMNAGICYTHIPLNTWCFPQSICFHMQVLMMVGTPGKLARCPPALETPKLYLNRVWVLSRNSGICFEFAA